MIYYFYGDQNFIKKGDKVKIIRRFYDEEREQVIEEVIEEIFVDDFRYDPENNLWMLPSKKFKSLQELINLLGDNDHLILRKVVLSSIAANG